MTRIIEVPDPCGQGKLIGVANINGDFAWSLARDDGQMISLGTRGEIRARIAASVARLDQVNAEMDDLVTKYPALKSVGNGAEHDDAA